MIHSSLFMLIVTFLALMSMTEAFAPTARGTTTARATFDTTPLFMSDDANADDNELVARRIIVTGDVQGGYYRSCVLNEAGRFRRLLGTMSPPDDSDTAEIYVEGKRKMVDGFIRWCKRGNVGLNQMTTVKEVLDESPTGLYDGFYVKTH